MTATFDTHFAQLETRALALELHQVTHTEVAGARAVVRLHAFGAEDADRLLTILGLRTELLGLPSAERRTKHGTRAAVRSHRVACEPLCAPCQLWFDKRYQRTRIPPGASCGTEAGARRHERLCEPVCGPCRQARNRNARARYHRQHTDSRLRGQCDRVAR